jgi:hypothetical protein
MAKIQCFSCQKELLFSDAKISFREECPHCLADVHACKNCLHYDPKAYNECRESVADVVREKDRANYCDHFILAEGRAMGIDKSAQLKAAAEALFKKSTSSS